MTQAVTEEKESKIEKGQDKSAAKSNGKIKATIYLTEEAEQAFAELYADRYVKDRKIDRLSSGAPFWRAYPGFVLVEINAKRNRGRIVDWRSGKSPGTRASEKCSLSGLSTGSRENRKTQLAGQSLAP